MKRIFAGIPASLLLLVAAQAAVHVDDAGRKVVLARPAQRVITLAPNLTEFVYAVGGGAAMVGTMDTSNFPDAAREVVRVGDYQRLDVERIVALQPDLILVWKSGNQGRELAQLEAAGLRLFYFEPRRLDDLPRALERIGALLGRRAQGKARAAQLQRDFTALRQRHANAAPVTVFFQVWSQPVMTLNGDHIVSDLMALCGGRNVFARLAPLAPHVSVEAVVAANPEAMLTTREFSADGPVARREPARPAFEPWRRFASMTAVRRGWMYSIPGDLLTRSGPRAIVGARAVCEALDEVRRERAASRKAG